MYLVFLLLDLTGRIHHRVFGFVTNFDGKLIWLNLLMLFFIVLLPFTTTLTEYGYLNESFVFYWTNVGLISFVTFFIQLHISNPKKNLSVGYEDKNERHYALSRSLLTSFIFFSGAALCFADNYMLQVLSRYIYVFIFPGIIILKKVYRIKKVKSNSNKSLT